jgi:HEAT repeat protein
MGNKSCDPLVKALYDDDKGVRLLAAWALGKTGEFQAIAALLRAGPDDDNLVQLAIDCAIERLLAGQPR